MLSETMGTRRRQEEGSKSRHPQEGGVKRRRSSIPFKNPRSFHMEGIFPPYEDRCLFFFIRPFSPCGRSIFSVLGGLSGLARPLLKMSAGAHV